MPVTTHETTTPKGHPYLRVESHGLVDDAAVAEVIPKINTSPLPLLVYMHDDTKLTTSARKAITKVTGEERKTPQAIIAPNPLVRAMMSFIIKALSIAQPNVSMPKMFGNEPDAVKWLDAELDAIAA